MGFFSWLFEEDLGKKAFRQATENRKEEWLLQSQEEDMYYIPDPHGIIAPNPCFYSDGSLKFDSRTKRTYPKGQYFCDSYGEMANNKKAPPDMKRPPRH